MTKVLRATTASKIFAVIGLPTIVLLATVPSWADRSTIRKLIELLILISLAQMWNLLAGFAGVVSVGQQAFVGLAAYSVVALVNVHGVGLYWAVPLAALGAALVSVPMGLVAFRLRGSYFAIGTWVLAEVTRLVMVNTKKVGGGSGASIRVTGYSIASRDRTFYWMALAVGIGSILLTYGLLRSKLGLQLQAIRDNEDGARSLGANVYRTRFLLWVVVAFMTGFSGAVFYANQFRVQPGEAFGVSRWTAPIIFMVIIGGIGTIEGPIIGAIAYWYFKERFSNSPEWYAIALGLLAMGIALFVQKGIWGLIRRRFDVHLFPVRRRVAADTGNTDVTGH